MHRLLLDLPAQIDTDRLILRPYRAGDKHLNGTFIYRLSKSEFAEPKA